HRLYMKNMGTRASMSISLLRDNRLWGLISCHSGDPRNIPFEVRKACEFIGQVLCVQIAALERNAKSDERVRLKNLESLLLAHMARHENFADGLVEAGSTLLEFAGATGAAVLHEGRSVPVGDTPGEDAIRALVEWLSRKAPGQDIYDTDRLSE